jgi:hypothetical protein
MPDVVISLTSDEKKEEGNEMSITNITHTSVHKYNYKTDEQNK